MASALGQIRLSAATVAGLAVVLTASPFVISPLHAGTAQGGGAARTVTVETVEYIEYGESGAFSSDDFSGGEFAVYYDDAPAPSAPVLARFGPFNVVSPDRVEMIGEADSYTPGEFRQLLAAYPGIRDLHIIDCGGTVDDNANLALARMIREAQIATHVPANGSARSGGIELFLARVRRSAEPGAEFIVHSWRDEYGREAHEIPLSDPAHRPYLAFYRDVGMAPERARAFYQLTNSVPHDGGRRLTLGELASFDLLN